MNWRGLAVLFVSLGLMGCSKSGDEAAKAIKVDDEWQKKIETAMQGEDYAAALKLIRPKADEGHPEGQFYMGFLQYSGLGITKDKAEAARWYRMAAEQGHAKAQANLGLMYHLGDGVEQDYQESIRLLQSAAERRDSGAQYFLGLIYSRGEGVPKDPVQAYFWLNLAAAEGAANAEALREKVAGTMTEEEIARAHDLARNWKSK